MPQPRPKPSPSGADAALSPFASSFDTNCGCVFWRGLSRRPPRPGQAQLGAHRGCVGGCLKAILAEFWLSDAGWARNGKRVWQRLISSCTPSICYHSWQHAAHCLQTIIRFSCGRWYCTLAQLWSCTVTATTVASSRQWCERVVIAHETSTTMRVLQLQMLVAAVRGLVAPRIVFCARATWLLRSAVDN